MQKKSKEQKVIERYEPDSKKGLSNEQVKERQDNLLTNNVKIKSSKSYLSIFAKNIFTYFNLIWFIIAVALLCVRAYEELLFLIVIVLNTAISIFQEIRAKITIEKLSLQTTPKIKVLREGKEEEIASEEIVLDDIIILENGDQIPSDCKVISGYVEANESLLTGESVPIKKNIGDNLYSGSFLVAGKCYARVDKIGKDNYIQTIATQAKQFKAPASNLFRDLNKLIKYIGIALIPLGIATFVKEWFLNYDITTAVTGTSGAITGMIPSGMFLLITIALSVGVVKLARKKTLVKDIYSIEMLARTDVLCLDKTGTITDGTMNVAEFINLSNKQTSEVENILANVLNAQNSSNMTSVAMVKKFGKSTNLAPKEIIEFSSSRKCSITTFENGKTYYLGAPTFTGVKLSRENNQLLKEKMQDGYRVIALVESSKKFDENQGPSGEKLLAYIVIEDHIRTDAIETIQWFKDNNVEIKIISGDDPVTVSKIAERVNVRNYDKYISLEGMSLEEVTRIAEEYTVFGRVSPEQKHTLVKALKNKGHVVAMTGDGVNDTLALKEADCSIAMADGSEVARNISKLVLLDSKFSSLPSVVKEGRQVINNVQKSSVLFIMKTLFTILLCITMLALNTSYPFSPKNIFLLEMFVIGLSPFLLTFEPNDNIIQGNFISQVLKRSIPRMFILFISVIVSMYAVKTISPTILENETLPVLALSIAGYLNLIWLCIPLNWYRAMVIILCGGLMAASIALLPDMFGIASYSDMAEFNPLIWAILGGIVAGCILLIILYSITLHFVKKRLTRTNINKKSKP